MSEGLHTVVLDVCSGARLASQEEVLPRGRKAPCGCENHSRSLQKASCPLLPQNQAREEAERERTAREGTAREGRTEEGSSSEPHPEK